MARNIDIDTSDFDNKSSWFEKKILKNTKEAINKVADEVLRLSQFEVPHDKGELQNSGMVDAPSFTDEVSVGYNKVYAARLHEHPEYRFQKGRKGKYLEDPIKNNLHIFRNIVGVKITIGLI